MDKAAAVIKQQAFSWPATPYQLKSLIPPLHPTVVKELVSSRLLESNMSPTQYRAWKNEVQANSAFFTKFLETHPTVTGPFLTALYNGVIFQSESEVAATQKLVKELVEQNMVVFQPVKKSIVKPEPMQEEESSPRASASSLPAERESVPRKADAEEKEDVLLKMSSLTTRRSHFSFCTLRMFIAPSSSCSSICSWAQFPLPFAALLSGAASSLCYVQQEQINLRENVNSAI